MDNGSVIAGLCAGAAMLGATAYWGGLEWCALCALMLLVLWFAQGRMTARAVIASIAGSLLWLAVFQWTGDRRIFFPFAMQLAAQASYVLHGRVVRPALVGGGGFAVAFLLIRTLQQATLSVLAFELAMSIVVILFVERIFDLGGRERASTCITAAAIGSALAFASLPFN